MDAIAKAPRTYYTMVLRGSSDLNLHLDGTKAYLGIGSIGTTTMDLKTRKKEPQLKKILQ